MRRGRLAAGDCFRYFNRDVECIRRFFRRRFRYESNIYPRFRTIKAEKGVDGTEGWHLDLVVCASGYDKGEQKVLEEVRIACLVHWSGGGTVVMLTRMVSGIVHG